ncbi:MAG: flavin reductase family protein [Flavobacteriaceae bacterium]|jgi:flavin reductase (DIM6/NTAB) family NADH-FMN oxidoreductase RutF|nr:flavin reductase family protein [Flavobacteriaceae bacterium]
MNTQEFRKICGQFATGVAVVTTSHNGENFGLTVNSFTSVSLDPSMVLFCVDRKARFNQPVQQSGLLAINFLKEHQKELSNRFANPTLSIEERYQNLTLTKENPAPVIADVLGHLECQIEAIHDGGDHHIYVARVLSGAFEQGEPLLYYAGNYKSLSSDS